MGGLLEISLRRRSLILFLLSSLSLPKAQEGSKMSNVSFLHLIKLLFLFSSVFFLCIRTWLNRMQDKVADARNNSNREKGGAEGKLLFSSYVYLF